MTRQAVGEKSLAKGEVEIKPRNGALQTVKTEDAIGALMKLLGESAPKQGQGLTLLQRKAG